MPKHGDTVVIKPAVEHRVLYAPGRFLDPEGMEVVWTPFLDERLRTGEVEIVHSEEHLEALRQERFNAGGIELAARELAPGEQLEAAPPPAGMTEEPLAPAPETIEPAVDLAEAPANPAIDPATRGPVEDLLSAVSPKSKE